MSAYVVVEFTVKDPEMYREKYAPIAGQTAKEHGGKVIAAGNWEVLHGDGSLTSGAMVRFTDRETALGWYNSPEYQQLIDVRSAAMDARFRLLDGLSLQTGRRQPQVSTRHWGGRGLPPDQGAAPGRSRGGGTACSATPRGRMARPDLVLHRRGSRR